MMTDFEKRAVCPRAVCPRRLVTVLLFVVLFVFLVPRSHVAVRGAELIPCEDIAFDEETRALVYNYCNSQGTFVDSKGELGCYIAQDVTQNTFEIYCKCKDEYMLPDCSLLKPTGVYYIKDEMNEVPNTCLLEDLLLKNAEKNDFDVYGHYVKGASERAHSASSP